jgi:hypothetical protein
LRIFGEFSVAIEASNQLAFLFSDIRIRHEYRRRPLPPTARHSATAQGNAAIANFRAS